MSFTLPALQLKHALLLLRVTVSAIFIAHAVTRFLNHTIPGFGEFLNNKGFVAGEAWVWLITVFEIAGGCLLAFGVGQRLLAYGFILLLLVGIVVIHAQLGWWVGEHGDGGMEYSVALIGALLVIGAAKNKTE